ncbi:hypothetical protein, partial [Enterococcus faecalis]|uniref:hypothetical protein n=1 Tax=Enterococcus faecalis TaxID=1351 RepID=UPI002456DEB9
FFFQASHFAVSNVSFTVSYLNISSQNRKGQDELTLFALAVFLCVCFVHVTANETNTLAKMNHLSKKRKEQDM